MAASPGSELPLNHLNELPSSDNPLFRGSAVASLEAQRLGLTSKDGDGLVVDKPALSPPPSGSDTMFGLAVLRPARAAKWLCCGTPNRKRCSAITVLILCILFFYVVGQLVETLKIMDTEPTMRTFTVGSLCDRYQHAQLEMEINNPSSTATTLLGMKSAIYFKHMSKPPKLLGYARTPDLYVSGGRSTMQIDLQLDFPLASAPTLHELLKLYIETDEGVGEDGEEDNGLVLLIQLPMTASFSSDVFLVPMSISTDFTFEFPLPSLSASNSTNSTSSSSSYLQDVEIVPASNSSAYLKAQLGLQLWNQTESSKFQFELPSLMFDVLVNGNLSVATGRTMPVEYGNPQADQVIHVAAALGEENLAGVHHALNAIFHSTSSDSSELPVSLVVVNNAAASHPELPEEEEEEEGREACYLHSMLAGLRIDLNMSTANLTSTTPTTGEEEDEPSSSFSLHKLQVLAIDAVHGLQAAVTVDLQALLRDLFNLRGVFPAVELAIDVIDDEDSTASLATVALPLGFTLNASQADTDVEFAAMLSNGTLLLTVADLVLLNNIGVTVRVRPGGSSLFSRLLGPVFVDVNLWELVNGAAVVVVPPSSGGDNRLRRRLQEDDSSYSIQLNLSSDEASILGDLRLTGIDTAFLGGLQLEFAPFAFDLFAEKYSDTTSDEDEPGEQWESMPVVRIVSSTGFDSDGGGGLLQFGLEVGDEYVGQLLQRLVTNVTNGVRVAFNASLVYDGNQAFSSALAYQHANLPTGLIKATAAPVASSSSSSVSSLALSIIELFHAELVSLMDDELAATVYFALDLGDNVAINISVPSIAIAVDRCDHQDEEPFFLGLFLDRWDFSTTNKDAQANLRAGLESTSLVLDMMTAWSEGRAQKICLRGHPTWGQNFLSYFVTSLVVDVELPGKDTTTTAPTSAPTTSITSLITGVDVESDSATHACASTELRLFDLGGDNGSSLAFSLGWGNAQFLFDVHSDADDDGTRQRLAAVELEAGWFGPVDAYRIARYHAPATPGNTLVSLCFGPNATHIRQHLQHFLDGTAKVTLTAMGSWASRLDDDDDTGGTLMSAEIGLPNTTFALLTNVVGSGSSSGDDASSSSVSIELDHVQLNQLHAAQLDVEVDARAMNLSSLLGFRLKTPKIQLRVGRLGLGSAATSAAAWASEVQWFDVSTHLPEIREDDDVLAVSALPVNVTLLATSSQGGAIGDWGRVLTIYDDFSSGNYSIIIGSTTHQDNTANLLSRIIPTITILPATSSTSTTPAPSTATNSPTRQPTTTAAMADYLSLSAEVGSTATEATIQLDVTLLERLPFAVSWQSMSFALYSGGATGSRAEIGHMTIPAQLPLQEVGSGPRPINVRLYGQSPAFLRQFLMNSSHATTVSLVGTMGGDDNAMSAWLTIPAFPNNLVEDDSITSQIQLVDVALLGTSNVGVNGTLPCFFESMCVTNMIRGDAQLAYGGVTVGVTFNYNQLPELAGIRWSIALNSDAVIYLSANGYRLGSVALRPPLTVSSAQTSFSPIVSFLPNTTNMAEMRSTIAAVMEGYDTVFSLEGGTGPSENFLSHVLDCIAQDFAIVDVPEPDPDAPSLLQTMTLSLVSTTRTNAVLEVAQSIVYDSASSLSPQISVGTMHADVLFGHTNTCGGGGQDWCLNGIVIATADTYGVLAITPSPLEQQIKIRGEGFHTGGVLSPSQRTFDDLMSRYVWSLEMPLEAHVDITPSPATRARYGLGGGTAFRMVTYLTIPSGQALSGFIDSIDVNMMGTVQSIASGDLKIKATKVLRNTMTFPILVSYFQYTIKLIDTDGVDSGNCNGASGGLVSNINPCSYGFCYEPYATPTEVAPLITSGVYSELKPATSLISGKQLILPGDTGSTDLTIDVSTQSGSRLADEMLIKQNMCGDLANGLIVIGLQANSACADSGKAEADLACTFPLRIAFDLKNYVLGGTDSCGSSMDVPSYLPFTFHTAGLYQFPSIGTAVVQLTEDEYQQSNTKSDLTPISLLDSFQLSFEFRAREHCFWGASEAMALQFMAARPANTASPKVKLTCSGTCEDHYASKGLQTTSEYASLVLAFYQCNSIAWIVRGDIDNPYRASQSCGGTPLDNEEWGKVTFTYNAHDKRAQVTYSQDSPAYPKRSFDFDLDLPAQLGGRTQAYLGMSANTAGATCSIIEYRNFARAGPRTHGLKTTLETKRLALPVAGQIGSVLFRARDENGRRRGAGGNTWTFAIENASTGQPANHNNAATLPGNVARFIDKGDGTYQLNYQIYTRGRYRISVACQAGAIPHVCNSPGVLVPIVSNLFIRANEE